MGKDKEDKKGGGFNLKVPKGTRDCMFDSEMYKTEPKEYV